MIGRPISRSTTSGLNAPTVSRAPLRVVHALRRKSFGTQQHGQAVSRVDIVVYDQNSHRPTGRLWCPALPRRACRRRFQLTRLRDGGGEPDDELRPMSGRRVGSRIARLDAATMQLDKQLHEGQAYTQATLRPVEVALRLRKEI